MWSSVWNLSQTITIFFWMGKVITELVLAFPSIHFLLPGVLMRSIIFSFVAFVTLGLKVLGGFTTSEMTLNTGWLSDISWNDMALSSMCRLTWLLKPSFCLCCLVSWAFFTLAVQPCCQQFWSICCFIHCGLLCAHHPFIFSWKSP